MKPVSNFIRMKRSAGFYDWAWDTVYGCKHGCEYCYGRRIAERRGRDFTKIMYFNDIWGEPAKVDPSMIFVNHLSDIMGDWVKSEWIEKVITVAQSLPLHTFLFMTKNPEKYKQFVFPGNCILGVTIESPMKWWRASIMEDLSNRKMASIEPILGDFTEYDFSQFEFVVVGGLMTFDGNKPSKEYFDTVKHEKIYYK